MKKYILFSLMFSAFGLSAQVESPESTGAENSADVVKADQASDTLSIPGLMVGVGILPGHQLRRGGFISTPVRVQIMGTKLYKGFGIFGALEFASADGAFMDNSDDPNDPTTWATSYFRHMLGLQYSFGKFGAYAGMDMFSRNGFFRSVGAGGTIGSGRKTLGVTYNAYKGLTVSLDFSAYAGPAVGLNYLIPLNGLK